MLSAGSAGHCCYCCGAQKTHRRNLNYQKMWKVEHIMQPSFGYKACLTNFPFILDPDLRNYIHNRFPFTGWIPLNYFDPTVFIYFLAAFGFFWASIGRACHSLLLKTHSKWKYASFVSRTVGVPTSKVCRETKSCPLVTYKVSWKVSHAWVCGCLNTFKLLSGEYKSTSEYNSLTRTSQSR